MRVLLNLQMVNFLKKVIFANSSKKCDQIFESFFSKSSQNIFGFSGYF